MSVPMIAQGEGGFLATPLRETSIDEVAALFLRASKDPSLWRIGMEIELIGFHRANLAPIAYPTMAKVLESIGERLSMTPILEAAGLEAPGTMIGLKGNGAIISLEPGGQLELATKPHAALKDLRREVCAYVDKLRASAEQHDVGFWAIGYHPFETQATMPKMPKDRYDVMRAYFARKGGRGLDMMHCTGSVQCAVDYRDESNMVNKIRTAARVSPFLAALVASSPFSRGRLSGYKTERYQVWLETDDERSGIWPEMLDEEGLTFRRYLTRALRAVPFFLLRDKKHVPPPEQMPFAHYAEHGFMGTPVTVGDLVDHLTTFFPEIRPKGYVELRSADCVRPREAVAIAGFWRAVLDDEEVRRTVDARLLKMGYRELKELQPLVAKHGLEARSAVGPVAEVAEWLVRIAAEGMGASAPDCAECLRPLIDLAESKRSPADQMIAVARERPLKDALERCVV